MPELELALTDLGRHVEFPPTPDVTPRVRERLAERPGSRRGLTRRRGLALAFALLAVAVAAVLAVPQTRAAILEFFHLRGVTIERVGELAGRTWSCSSPPTTKPASIGSPQT